MKKTLLSIAIALGAFSTTFAQEPYPCHTDEKTQEFVDGLTPQQKVNYQLEKITYEQEIQQFVTNNPQLRSNSMTKSNTITYTIPVVFHIIHENGTENISDQQVHNAVKHMNDDYQKLNNHEWENVVSEFLPLVADIEVEFVLAKKDPTGNCTNGITRTYSSVTNGGPDSGASRIGVVKAKHGNWPGNKYINIYVAKQIGGAAGYTTYPNNFTATSMSNGIHVLHNYVGSIGTSGSSGAHTLTHEVGHWLNLPHLWGNSNEPGVESNCGIDDGVADTPLTKGWTTCTLNGRTCDGTLDNVENFMEYSYCSKMFTLGQKQRMHAALNSSVGGRKNIWSEANLAATGVSGPAVLCEAKFDSDTRVVCQGETVTFEDLSHDGVSSREWYFQNGSPSTSSSESPTVTYNTPGTYEVKLTVSDGTTTKVKTKSTFITVLRDPAPFPFFEGFEHSYNIGYSFWIVENQGNSAAFDIVTDVAHSGSHSLKLENFGEQKGNLDAVVSQPIDLSSVTSPVTLSFRYAYRKRQAANNETLIVYLSNSCDETWSQRKTLLGSSLGTEIATTAWTPSSAADWKTVHMTNVTSNFWVDNFRMKFEFKSDGGNNLFIDDINLYSGSSANEPSLGIEESEFIQSFNVYPNPASSITNVSFNVENDQIANISLVNMMGQNIQHHEIQAKNGENLVMLDTDTVQAGVYFVNVNVGGVQQTKRLIIQ